MALADVTLWVLAAGILAVCGWYFVHVILSIRDGISALKTLPAALERAFDGDVPPWLRLVRVVMIFLVCVAVAALVAHKFKLGS